MVLWRLGCGATGADVASRRGSFGAVAAAAAAALGLSALRLRAAGGRFGAGGGGSSLSEHDEGSIEQGMLGLVGGEHHGNAKGGAKR